MLLLLQSVGKAVNPYRTLHLICSISFYLQDLFDHQVQLEFFWNRVRPFSVLSMVYVPNVYLNS